MNSQKPKARAIFAANLRAARKARGVSQEALADAAGLHRTYVGSVERGERNVSIDNMERLAAAIGVELATLVRVAR
jgi:transcriptional regulator with XRE-family HTH domain